MIMMSNPLGATKLKRNTSKTPALPKTICSRNGHKTAAASAAYPTGAQATEVLAHLSQLYRHGTTTTTTWPSAWPARKPKIFSAILPSTPAGARRVCAQSIRIRARSNNLPKAFSRPSRRCIGCTRCCLRTCTAHRCPRGTTIRRPGSNPSQTRSGHSLRPAPTTPARSRARRRQTPTSGIWSGKVIRGTPCCRCTGSTTACNWSKTSAARQKANRES